MKNNLENPPKNTKREYGWHNLKPNTEYAPYSVTDEGQGTREIIVGKKQRQVLEGLMEGPIFAASYCRVGNQVLALRHDHGVDIACDMYRNDPETGRERYGVYRLVSDARRADYCEVAV